ncbi:Glycine oxidase [Planctomycetes bacterium FF15]|uniref:Glycine oxidase n=1 Tax=Bremerella alba TaxID=980252 RepID=A0A7V8V7I9_9BACT|nr:Glycine oxidase [Bremerella alba]
MIGLSIAYELAGKGRQVLLVEKGALGREASWAGAGLLPPANQSEAWDPQEQLRGLSHQLFPEWSARLKAETQIDNEFEVSGGLYLARDPGEAASLRMACVHYEEEGVEVQRLDPPQLAERFPHLKSNQSIRDAVFLPGEAVVRNPRHLQALVQGCRNRGVEFLENTQVARWRFQGEQLTSVEIDGQEISPGTCCLATGAWSQLLTDQVLDQRKFSGRMQRPEIEPIRGQLVLLDAGQRFFTSPINEGVRYIVPRQDGLVLVGATVEEAGFDKSTTPEAIEDLTQFARQWVPQLADARQVKAWSGLRPASVDRIPYLGQLPGMANVYLAAGHYRSGLHLSPATATVMSQLMCGEQPQVDLHPFRVNRA